MKQLHLDQIFTNLPYHEKMISTNQVSLLQILTGEDTIEKEFNASTVSLLRLGRYMYMGSMSEWSVP